MFKNYFELFSNQFTPHPEVYKREIVQSYILRGNVIENIKFVEKLQKEEFQSQDLPVDKDNETIKEDPAAENIPEKMDLLVTNNVTYEVETEKKKHFFSRRK